MQTQDTHANSVSCPLSITSQPPRASARSWCHSAAQLHGSFCNCQHTRIPYVSAATVLLHTTVPVDVIAGVCVFLLVARRSFCKHQRSRLAETTMFNTPFVQIDGSCSSRGVAARLHGKLRENSFKKHLPGLLCAFFKKNMDDTADGVPTDQHLHNHCECTDGHCSSSTVAS